MSWAEVSLGEVSKLSYGKALQGYVADQDADHAVQVFGTNGPIGWARNALSEPPTIIVGRKGAYRGIHFANSPSWTIDTAFYTEIDSKRVDMRWLFYRLRLVDINRMNSGGAIPSTRREDFYAVMIKLPDLDAQKRMAAIVSVYDALIENNRRRIRVAGAGGAAALRSGSSASASPATSTPSSSTACPKDGSPSVWATS